MSFTPSSLPTASFPPADALLEALSTVDYRKLAHRALMVLATLAAVAVGVSQFLYYNARKFWGQHGETITLAFYEFINWLEITIERVYQAGVNFRPVANRFVATIADRVYYYLAEVA